MTYFVEHELVEGLGVPVGSDEGIESFFFRILLKEPPSVITIPPENCIIIIKKEERDINERMRIKKKRTYT